jgi:hypothetical protein
MSYGNFTFITTANNIVTATTATATTNVTATTSTIVTATTATATTIVTATTATATTIVTDTTATTIVTATTATSRSRDGVVGITTGYGLDDRGFGVRVKNFLFFKSSRPAVGCAEPPIQWVQWASSSGVKQPGREADH